MPTTDPAGTIMRALEAIDTGRTSLAANLTEPVAAMLTDALNYARLPRWREYPTAVRGVALAEALLNKED